MVIVGNSWSKRNSHWTVDVNNNRIVDQGYIRYWKRYDEWKSHWLDRNGKWKKVPVRWGDSWNARLKCWNSEIHSGKRDPETGELIEEED